MAQRVAILAQDLIWGDRLARAVQAAGAEPARAKTAPDVMGIGVPLVCGERRFGLAVAGPIYRMDGRRQELATALQRAAADIRTDFAQGAASGPMSPRRPGALSST